MADVSILCVILNLHVLWRSDISYEFVKSEVDETMYLSHIKAKYRKKNDCVYFSKLRLKHSVYLYKQKYTQKGRHHASFFKKKKKTIFNDITI